MEPFMRRDVAGLPCHFLNQGTAKAWSRLEEAER